ncbi:hypothetical protein ACCO45_010118 [Purpureocillium lilacinum]|uniref:Uncharacterized protein n=1 Tax=Purpureocillium lilacinum TaxID=33203 RepID=A0ACC4DDW4_PURLI
MARGLGGRSGTSAGATREIWQHDLCTTTTNRFTHSQPGPLHVLLRDWMRVSIRARDAPPNSSRVAALPTAPPGCAHIPAAVVALEAVATANIQAGIFTGSKEKGGDILLDARSEWRRGVRAEGPFNV